MKFKKITAIAGSVLMTGLTIATAAAASFPMPFVENGKANVAIVYGADADLVAANNVHTALGKFVTSTGDTIVSGEGYKFEKSSTKFHLGDDYTTITTNLDEDELPVLLADGKYVDDDNDEFDYSQKIVMTANALGMFEDNDYKEDVPTIGFRIPSGTNVLTYTLTFSDEPLISDMPTSDLPLMGTEYYVLSNTTFSSSVGTLTLLDSATETVLAESETATVDGKSVTISFIGSNQVKLTVDGETTNTLAAGETYKLSDESYVGVKDILYSSKEGTASKVEFSIGSGKLKVTGGQEVELNDNAISGLTATFVTSTSDTKMTSISLAWAADDDVFITEDMVATMPGFEVVALSFGGLTYPTEEEISIKQGGDTYATLDNFPLKDGEADIDFLYGNSTYFTNTGKDATNLLRSDDNDDGNITYDKDTDEYFIASWTNTDEAESYLVRATNFVLDGSDNKSDIQYYKDGVWTDKKSGVKETDTFSIGSVDLTVGAISRTGKTIEIWKTSADTASSITSFNTLYSMEGLTLYLPWLNTTATNIFSQTEMTDVVACDTTHAGAGVADAVGELGFGGVVTYNDSTTHASATVTCTPRATTFVLKTVEEDENENQYSGDMINITLGWDSSSTPEVEVSSIATTNTDATSTEIEETDVWRDFTYSALATEILYEKPSSGQKSVKLMYHGDEVSADVFITSADAVVTGTSAAADFLPVKASQIDSVKSKNLVIVGGSCINAAAATALGGAYCGEEFTTMTGVSSGQFLIQGMMDKFATGKLALVVAGYEAADTKNAVTYLTKMEDVDTSTKMVKGLESVQDLA